ncbi:aspartyl/glutamyl-tRNA amidotransferase subunit A [Candidatus Mycoplasma haematolamae str. Purdue]|uniref:Aspartyl/glutamyl-tRNA amidotransferase subunit A n=1 Tax=Mycoplasma haematolamae (strain Purdue) TaxID=1212765 RepID=I7BJM1_MYCHA|nr:aspartyl/glutamyl-tRNA amidotransferase subunit A [Candidatus Mycoplasma haematolamae str. Purdue]
MGGGGIWSNTGIIPNAHAETRLCGGSSVGSAYMVAKKAVDFSIGTDTGGSIRVPSSYNSIYGLKPSFGLISRDGILPLTTTLDTPGILANSLEVVAKVLSVIAVPDKRDLTTLKTTKRNYLRFSSAPIKDWTCDSEELCAQVRFLVVRDFFDFLQTDLSPHEKKIKENYQNLISRLCIQHDCEIQETSMKDWPFLLLSELVYKIVAYSDALSHYLSLNGIVTPWTTRRQKEEKVTDSSIPAPRPKFAGEVKELVVGPEYLEKAKEIRSKFGEEVKIRHLLGYFFLYQTNYENLYLQARRIVTLYREKVSRSVSRGEVLITPTTFTVAPPLVDYSNAYVNDSGQSFVLMSNFSGTPSISIPWLQFPLTEERSIVPFEEKLEDSKDQTESTTMEEKEIEKEEVETKLYVGLHLLAKHREDKYLLSTVAYLERNNLL